MGTLYKASVDVAEQCAGKRQLLIFVHIPKTAGTTLSHMLQAYAGENGLFSAYPDAGSPHRSIFDWTSLSVSEKTKYRVVLGHYDFSTFDTVIDGVEKRFLTFLRSPVERIISLYNHSMRFDPDYQENKVSLLKFLTESPPSIQIQVNNHQTRMIAGLGEEAPINRAAFKKAKRNLESGFFFVRTTENFASNVRRLSRMLNFELPDVEAQNVAADNRGIDYYSSTERNMILSKNYYDMKLFRCALARTSDSGIPQRVSQQRWPRQPAALLRGIGANWSRRWFD